MSDSDPFELIARNCALFSLDGEVLADQLRERHQLLDEPLKTALRRLPPGCIVEAVRPDLQCPGPGKKGRVIGYAQAADRSNGIVFVTHTGEFGGPDVAAGLEPGWVRVVEYGPLSASDVDGILGAP